MAMNLSNLRAPKKANTKRKRVGRGMGIGHGQDHQRRGHKGQGSRSGSSLMRGFEGGQMPLHRRLPQARPSPTLFRTEYTVINLSRIADLKETELTAGEAERARSCLKKKHELVKVLGSGEITGAVTVHAHKFSKSAQEKIEKAGGKVVVIGA